MVSRALSSQPRDDPASLFQIRVIFFAKMIEHHLFFVLCPQPGKWQRRIFAGGDGQMHVRRLVLEKKRKRLVNWRAESGRPHARVSPPPVEVPSKPIL